MRRPALLAAVLLCATAVAPARAVRAQADADSAESVAVAAPPAEALRAVVGALARAGFVVVESGAGGTVAAQRYGGVSIVTAYAAVVPAGAPGDTSASRAYSRVYFRLVSQVLGTGGAPTVLDRGSRNTRDVWARLDAAKRELAGVRVSQGTPHR